MDMLKQSLSRNQGILDENEMSMKLAYKLANIAGWEWDYNRDKFHFTKEAYNILGIEKEDYDINLQNFIDDFIYDADKGLVKGAIEGAIHLGVIDIIEYRVVSKNGNQRWIRTNGEVVYDDDGNGIKVIGTFQDITEWKKVDCSPKGNLGLIQSIMDSVLNPIFYKDYDGIYKHCNTAFLEYLGLKYEDVVGKGVYDIYPRELADIYYKADNELMKNRGKQIYESKFTYNDGSLRDVIFNKAAITDENDRVTGLVGVIVDITERKASDKRIQRLLKLKEVSLEINQAIIGINNISELFNLILEKISQVIENAELGCVLLLDDDETLKVTACKGYNKEKSQEYRLNLRETFYWNQTNGNLKQAIIINDIQRLLSDEFPSILENDEIVKVQSSISSPIIVDGKLYGLVNIDSSLNYVYDDLDLEMMEYLRNQIAIVISKHKLYEETIYLSRFDNLTNVYNRSYFEELCEKHMEEAIRKNQEFYLVLYDLNGLKLVNDTYGHLAGDKLIQAFSSKMNDFTGPKNIFARFGGDEFIAIFTDVDLEWLNNGFHQVMKFFKNNPFVFKGNHISCEFSYGIAKFPEDSNTYNELVRVADERMYKFKKKIKEQL